MSGTCYSTTGVPFTTHPTPTLHLPPNAFQTVRLAGFATLPGELLIKGAIVRLPDGSEAEFLLPLHDAAEEKRQRKRESVRFDAERSLKLSGIEARPSERRRRLMAEMGPEESLGGGRPGHGIGGGKKDGVEKYLSCQVVKEQPMMRIRGTSLTHGAIMLYDGEESVQFLLGSFGEGTVGRFSVRNVFSTKCVIVFFFFIHISSLVFFSFFFLS